MATYLVTGGAGFIGSHLCEALVEAGHAVRVLDNLSTGRVQNLASFRSGLELIEGDVADAATCARVVEGVDYVLHQAAVPSVPRSIEDPLGTDRANIHGTVTMLDAAARAGVRRFVLAASSAAYGDTEVLPKVEDMPVRPLSPYAVQKVAAEHYCQVFTRTRGLPTVALRYFNVFGPRQDPRSEYAAVVPRFATAVLQGRPVTLYGDGLQSRDFTPVRSVVDANLRACTSDAAVGQVINVARGDRLTLLDLVSKIEQIVGRTVERRFEPGRAGDVRHSLADIGRARTLLGYAPGDLDAALREVVSFYSDR